MLIRIAFALLLVVTKVGLAQTDPQPGNGDHPIAFEGKTVAGDAIHFPNDYKGKLVMLDFWATWCGPCRAELPGLVKTYEEFHGKGFEVLGISLDDQRTMGKLQQFMTDNHMAWPQIADGQGWKAAIAAQYSVRSIPAAFLIDGKSGLIVATGVELRGENLRATIESRLAKLGGPVEPHAPTVADPVIARAAELLKDGKLLATEKFEEEMKTPVGGAVELLAPSTSPLSPRAIAKRAHAAYLRAGWYYQCTKCGNWHIHLAGGYAVAGDTAVTAHHVMQLPPNMKPGTGYPIFVRGEDEVIPVTAVIADNAALDATVVRLGVTNLAGLPLAADVEVGDSVWCLSDPHGIRDYFSNGIVNRFFTDGPHTAQPDPNRRRINVSTDWAPGSSGAAVLDSFGNAVGHVATINPIFANPPAAAPGTAATGRGNLAMNLHAAIPAASIRELITAKAK